VDVGATAAAAIGVTPPQHLWYLGGPGTLPAHPFHQYVGDRAVQLDVTAWRTLVPRLLRLRLLAAAGWSHLTGEPPVPFADPGLRPWQPQPTEGVRASIGAGLGLLHGLLRLDYMTPIGGGGVDRGSLIFSVDPRIKGLL
jgi:hypothetical protein